MVLLRTKGENEQAVMGLEDCVKIALDVVVAAAQASPRSALAGG
jgi:hypothetical protein